MYYYQRSRRKNRQHQNEELKNEAERLPNSRSQSAHLTDEQVEQVLSAIRAAKSSTDLSSRSTTDSMRSRSSSRPPPPSTPPPPLPKSKINQDVVRDDRQHVPTKPKFDEEMQNNSKVRMESAPNYYSSSTTMRSRSSSRPPPPSTPPPPLPKSKKSPKNIATTSTKKSKEIPKYPNHNLHSNCPKINDSSTEINMDITTNGCSNESLSSSTSLLSSSPKLAPNLKNDDANANDSDDDDEPFEWVDNPTYDEKEDENSEWSHNPTYSNPSDQEIKINFNEEDFNEENIKNIIPPIPSVPSTPKVGVFQKIFHLLF